MRQSAGLLAVQQRQQRASLQDVVRRLAAEIIEEGRRQVDRLDQCIAHGAARAVGGGRRIDHDQRNLGRLLVEQILLAHPVIAEIVAMVRREHDHGGVEQAARFEELHQDAHLVVDLLDQAHIGRNDFFARLVARHVAGIAHVHIGGEHRMRVGALLLRADHRLDVLRPIHAGVGLRRDIGPVRLDVGQMQAPWPSVVLGFRNELHRAPRHVGRLGMLVRHARGLVGVHQQPAVLQAPVLGRAGIGPVLPRVRRVVAVLAQIIVVGRPRPPGRMQAVVALIRLEPAFRHVHADNRVRGMPRFFRPSRSGAIWVLPTSTLRTPIFFR